MKKLSAFSRELAVHFSATSAACYTKARSQLSAGSTCIYRDLPFSAVGTLDLYGFREPFVTAQDED